MDEPVKVDLLGRSHHVVMPDFSTREELIVAYSESGKRGGVTLLRVYSAALGLCTRLGREAGVEYSKHRYDVLSYGGEMYGWLRDQGIAPKDIAIAAIRVIEAVGKAMFPRAVEVEEAAKNSEAGGAS